MSGIALVADADASHQRLVLGHLKQLGWRALAAADGRETLDRFEQSRPNLLLISTRLPELDGIAVCRRLDLSINSETRAILLVEPGFDASDSSAHKHGAHGAISKPASLSALREKIDLFFS